MKKEESFHFQGGVGMTAQKNKKLLTIPLSAIVAAISTGKFLGSSFMDTIEKIRASAYKSPAIKKLKEQLPFILSSVSVLDADLSKGPALHLGTAQLDFDFEQIFNRDERMLFAIKSKEKIKDDPYILLAFFSPQFGLKVICRIPADLEGHEDRLKALSKYFRVKYNLDHDPSCNGPKRLAFLSYDPAPVYNAHCLVFEEIERIAPATRFPLQDDPAPGTTRTIQREETLSDNHLTPDLILDIEFCVTRIAETKTDITAIQKDWHSIGMSFASLGEVGRKYFHSVSENYPRYTIQETDKEFDYCLKTTNGSVSIATFFYYCKQYGIPLRKRQPGITAFENKISQIESSILSETPTLDQSIYPLLPEPLHHLCSLFDHVRTKDMVLVSSLAVLGPIMHKVYGTFFGKKIHPTIFVFIVAPPASNKSVVSWSKRLASLVEGYLIGLWNAQKDEHAAAGGKEKDKPVPTMYFVPANSTAAGLIQLLSAMQTGVIWETEADTMSAILATEHGNYLHHLRDIFDHAQVKQYRKTEKDYVSIERPIFSVMLTGTPGQVLRLIKDGDSGIHSRFVFYGFDDKPIYISPFSDISQKWSDSFDLAGRQIFDLYNYLRDKEEIKFSFTSDQQQTFDRTVANWQAQSDNSHGRSGVSISNRSGEILFRVSMLLTCLRTKCRAELICNDVDFEIAIKLVESFRVHSLAVLATFPDPPKPTTTEGKTIERFYQLLPNIISSKDAVAMHKEFGVSDRTIQRYLKKLRETGKISLDVSGVYRKR